MGSGSRALCAACRCMSVYEDDSPDGSDTPSETDGWDRKVLRGCNMV